MSSEILDEQIQRSNSLTVDEQLRLAAYLVERVRETSQASIRRRKWREIRGLAHPGFLGEDAQTWVSRTRREADERQSVASQEI